MSQDYSDDVFGSTQQVQTNMQQIEDNFAALKSAFSGATTPADTVAGMVWLDTTASLMKIRNIDNNAWLSIWDMTNNKPIIANLSAEITLAMMAAACSDAAAGTASLRSLGTTATKACAGNDARLSDTRTPPDLGVTEAKLAASAVAQSKLKTSTGEVSVELSNSYGETAALPGGEYGFQFQIKGSGVAFTFHGMYFSGLSTSTYTQARARFGSSSSSGTGYAQQRYVTSSGEVFWLFILRDKVTKEIVKTWSAPDHPCMGNGGKPLVMPHPFGVVDLSKYEIIVVNPREDELQELTNKTVELDEAKPDRSLLQVILEDYEIDEKGGSPDWPKKAVTVGLPPGVDWKRMPEGTILTPIKKVIPDMGFVRRTLRVR